MSRRLVYLACGGVAGVLALRSAALAAQAAQLESAPGDAQPATAQEPVVSLGERLADFMAEVRVLMAEREQELRADLGLDGTHDLVDAAL